MTEDKSKIKKTARKDKIPNVLEKIHTALKHSLYRDTLHSAQRQINRNITISDILEVLEKGYHEKIKDEYRTDFQSWNYAIRGKTFEGDELRIAVYFEEEILMIATVIKL